MSITFSKLSPVFVGEVSPIDLRQVRDRETLEKIRAGMDEFGVLVQTDFQQASELSKRLELSLASPIYVHQTPRYLSVSIGVAERTAGVDLIRAADEAMYIAKGAR